MILSIVAAVALSQLSVRQDGGTVGPVNAVNCVGPNVTCSRSGSTWQLSASGGASVPACDPATQYVVADGGSFGCVTPAASSSRDPVFAQFAVGGPCSTSPCTLLAGAKNVSSVTRSAAGQYTVNFTTAYPTSPYYVVQCFVQYNVSTGATRLINVAGQAQAFFDLWTYSAVGTTTTDAAFQCIVFKDYSTYP